MLLKNGKEYEHFSIEKRNHTRRNWRCLSKFLGKGRIHYAPSGSPINGIVEQRIRWSVHVWWRQFYQSRSFENCTFRVLNELRRLSQLRRLPSSLCAWLDFLHSASWLPTSLINHSSTSNFWRNSVSQFHWAWMSPLLLEQRAWNFQPRYLRFAISFR